MCVNSYITATFGRAVNKFVLNLPGFIVTNVEVKEHKRYKLFSETIQNGFYKASVRVSKSSSMSSSVVKGKLKIVVVAISFISVLWRNCVSVLKHEMRQLNSYMHAFLVERHGSSCMKPSNDEMSLIGQILLLWSWESTDNWRTPNLNINSPIYFLCNCYHAQYPAVFSKTQIRSFVDTIKEQTKICAHVFIWVDLDVMWRNVIIFIAALNFHKFF